MIESIDKAKENENLKFIITVKIPLKYNKKIILPFGRNI